jgi:hypothetical protein
MGKRKRKQYVTPALKSAHSVSTSDSLMTDVRAFKLLRSWGAELRSGRYMFSKRVPRLSAVAANTERLAVTWAKRGVNAMSGTCLSGSALVATAGAVIGNAILVARILGYVGFDTAMLTGISCGIVATTAGGVYLLSKHSEVQKGVKHLGG